MVFLFRSGTVRQKVDLVLRATRTHARNLAKFATIYKTTCYLLKRFGTTPGKEGECPPPLYVSPWPEFRQMGGGGKQQGKKKLRR